MNLSYNIELVDTRSYEEAHPSPYWGLLAMNLIPKGFGKWVTAGDELRAFVPKQAAEQLLESEWIKNPDAAMPDKPTMTYLMVDDRDGLIKIGCSTNPQFREATLQGQAPQIRLLAVCGDNVERLLHKLYAPHRVRGEWFRLTEDQVSSIMNDYPFTKVVEKP